MSAAWCPNGGGRPAAVRDHTGVCWKCNRRVGLLSSGKLRRHRMVSAVELIKASTPP